MLESTIPLIKLRNVAVGGHIIRKKALDFAKELGITGSVVFRTVSGEERSYVAETTASWE